MNKIKQCIILAGILLSGVSAQAVTIVDVQDRLDHALERGYLDYHTINEYMYRKMKAGLIGDIEEVKEIIKNYKEKLMQQSIDIENIICTIDNYLLN